MLASVRYDRKTAGETTAVRAGLVVSRHKDYVVGDAGAVRLRKLGASLQGGDPPRATLRHRSDEGHRGDGFDGSTGTLVLGVDFARRSLSLFQLLGVISDRVSSVILVYLYKYTPIYNHSHILVYMY